MVLRNTHGLQSNFIGSPTCDLFVIKQNRKLSVDVFKIGLNLSLDARILYKLLINLLSLNDLSICAALFVSPLFSISVWSSIKMKEFSEFSWNVLNRNFEIVLYTLIWKSFWLLIIDKLKSIKLRR